MSNFATLVEWAKTQTEEQLANVLQILGIAPNTTNHDTPGVYGDVALRSLRPTRPETHFRFVTREIVGTMPAGPEKDFANHLISVANAWFHYSLLKFSPCRDPQGHAIANLFACPDVDDPSTGTKALLTVQSITDALNAEPDPTTGNGDGFGQGPHN